MSVLPNFLAQKSMKLSKQNFIFRYFKLRLRADSILIEIEPKLGFTKIYRYMYTYI